MECKESGCYNCQAADGAENSLFELCRKGELLMTGYEKIQVMIALAMFLVAVIALKNK